MVSFWCRKLLLTEGVGFLMKVFHLFPPIDQVQGTQRAQQLRDEAVFVCTTIIDELLDSLPDAALNQEAAESSTQPIKAGDLQGVEPEGRDLQGVEPEGEDLQGVEEDLGRLSVETREVSDEERMADKKIRLRIYSGLLNLACAMVGVVLWVWPNTAHTSF